MKSVVRIAIGAVLVLCAGLVSAHPGLVSSTPRAGESLATPPSEMRLEFNEAIELAFTSVKLIDAEGKEVRAASARADPADTRAVVVRLPALTAGTYKARWSAVGRDGHRVKGEFGFTVK